MICWFMTNIKPEWDFKDFQVDSDLPYLWIQLANVRTFW